MSQSENSPTRHGLDIAALAGLAETLRPPPNEPAPWFHDRDPVDSATPFVVYRRMGDGKTMAHGRFQFAHEAVAVVEALNALHREHPEWVRGPAGEARP